MKKCKKCGHELSIYGNNYYCCDKQEAVCSFCRTDQCKKCNQRRLNIVEPSKCMVCWSRNYKDNAFKQPTCGKQFCPKCLSKIFNQTLKKTFISNNGDSYYDQPPIKLSCGDTCSFIDLASYFKDYCVQCGKDYQQTLDIELNNGLKLCYVCDSSFHDKYLQAFIKCNICECCIKAKSKAGIFNLQGLTLCTNCCHESQMEEKHLQTKKQLNQSRKKSHFSQKHPQSNNSRSPIFQQPKKHPQVKENSFFSEQKYQYSISEKKFQQSFSELKVQQNLNQQKAQFNVKVQNFEAFQSQKSSQELSQQKKLPKKQSQVTPLRRIIQKNWLTLQKMDNQKKEQKDDNRHEIKNQKQSQVKAEKNEAKQQNVKEVKYQQKNQQKSDQKSNDSKKIQLQDNVEQINERQNLKATKKQKGSLEYLVTNKLINEEEQVDQKLKDQLGVSGHLVLKKFISDETLVENLILELPLVEPHTFVKCECCNSKIPIKLAYDIDAKPQNKHNSSSLLCISAFEQSLSSAKTKDTTFNCRVCYHKLIQNEKKQRKFHLEESISTNDKSFRANISQRTTLSDSRRTVDSLRPNNSFQRKNIDPSPNLYKVSPYGLIGAKLPDQTLKTQNLYNSRNQSIRKTQTYFQSQSIKLNERQSIASKPSASMKPSVQTMHYTTGRYLPQRRANDKYLAQKCVYCGLHKKEVISSFEGKYCMDCYKKKKSLLYADRHYMMNLY